MTTQDINIIKYDFEQDLNSTVDELRETDIIRAPNDFSPQRVFTP